MSWIAIIAIIIFLIVAGIIIWLIFRPDPAKKGYPKLGAIMLTTDKRSPFEGCFSRDKSGGYNVKQCGKGDLCWIERGMGRDHAIVASAYAYPTKGGITFCQKGKSCEGGNGKIGFLSDKQIEHLTKAHGNTTNLQVSKGTPTVTVELLGACGYL